jgi:hypothetical protein
VGEWESTKIGTNLARISVSENVADSTDKKVPKVILKEPKILHLHVQKKTGF